MPLGGEKFGLCGRFFRRRKRLPLSGRKAFAMRPKRRFRIFAVLLLLVFPPVVSGLDPALSPELPSLRAGLQAYGDLFHLCFWHDGLHAGQSSSHDERDLNIDLMHFHGRYRGGRVLARLTGPGVVYRIWSAGPSGRLELWADDADQPVVACDFKAFLLGECAAEKAFAVGRYANYTPLPFKKSVIITAQKYKLDGAYYQVSYMTYEKDPGLKTMSPRLARDDEEDLARAVRFWESGGGEAARDPGGIPLSAVSLLQLGPGEQRMILLPGPGLVTELKLRDPQRPLAVLDELLLRIYWDQNEEPAVTSPVDAFFGNRFNSREKSAAGPYQTLTLSATAEGYASRWPMPFASGMRLVVENTGPELREVLVEISYRGLAGLPENTLRFHALYREQDYPDDLSRDKIHGLFYRVDQSTNYVVLEREGRGYYAGCFLYVRNLGPEWWGEGDEMIWVDEDPLALIRGTGTEDEFNWSFGFKENRSPVSGALLVTRFPKKAPHDAVGYNVLFRYRPGDFVPFRKKIKVTYERLGNTWMKRYPGSPVNVTHHRGDDYRSVAYWYEAP